VGGLHLSWCSSPRLAALYIQFVLYLSMKAGKTDLSKKKNMHLERGLAVNVLALGCHPKGHVLWAVADSCLSVNKHQTVASVRRNPSHVYISNVYISKRSIKARIVPKFLFITFTFQQQPCALRSRNTPYFIKSRKLRLVIKIVLFCSFDT
jgi:hypothetical protein